MPRCRKPRRGVLLLIVLSLLVLFVLIGVTFVVVAGQYTKAAKAYSRHELKGDPPAKELDGAMLQLVRGSSDPNDLMYRHNLLRDVYGVDGFEGVVLNTAYGGQNGQQFLAMQFGDVFRGARPTDHYYAGSVFTLLDGQGVGQSTRIVGYRAPKLVNGVWAGLIYLESFADLPPGFMPAPSTRFLVNGKPFNGSGDGYNPMTGKLDDRSVLAMPQSSAPPETALMPLATPTSPYGDSDETWDGPDYQNLFLARIPSQIPPSGVPSNADPLIPSFHRPFLINYWMHRLQKMGLSWGEPTSQILRRYVVARPMPDDHPFFTGSNPKFAMLDFNADGIPDLPDQDGDRIPDLLDADDISTPSDGIMDHPLVRGPWDVDNDNDGVADSIWIDLGSPVKTAPDGRLYKPLYAILCVDMDGRLNINAHGTREVLAMAGENLGAVNDPYAAGLTDTITLGQGYGPVEIRLDRFLAQIFQTNGLPTYAKLLNERYRPRIGLSENPPAPGTPDLQTFPNNNSFLSTIHLWGLPGDYTAPLVSEGNLYTTPPDLSGVGGIYLDQSGQPRYLLNQVTQSNYPQMGTTYELRATPFTYKQTNAAQDDPYEMDLVTLRGDDSAFGEEELEQIVRHNDLDMQTFATPLAQILGPLPNNNPLSRRLTTRSFDIPTLNATIPDDQERAELAKFMDDAYRNVGATFTSPNLSSYSLVELATKRLLKSDPNRTDVPQQLQMILSSEVRAGQRMDVNRLFANGIDDTTDTNATGYGVVDEPSESVPGQLVWTGTPFAARGQYGADDPHYNPDNAYFSRQQFARHLYCLAMLAMDDGFTIPNATSTQSRRVTARRLAQWAINVVDFRDPDSAMTPFEYDLDPFDDDGWNVDDDYRTQDTTPDRQIIWGCEAPELLITETLAFHDRRVRDTDMEAVDSPDDDGDDGVVELRFPSANNNDQINDNVQDIDATLDQFRIPQGSLYLELYATGNSFRNNPVVRRDLYNLDGTLSLARVVTDAQGSSPVWRVAIARAPQNPDPTAWTDSEKAVLAPALLNPFPYRLDEFRLLVNDDGQLAGTATYGVPESPQLYDRFIVFIGSDPTQSNLLVPPGSYFYNRGLSNGYQEPNLLPGEYAVIGPRPVTVMGSRVRSKTSPPTTDQNPSEPSYQRIVMRRNGVFFYDLSPAPPFPQGVMQQASKRALTIIAAADPRTVQPNRWTRVATTAPMGIGVNVSEPFPSIAYYREPITGFPASRPDIDPGSGGQSLYLEPYSYYSNLSTGEKTLPDVPFDNPKASAAYPLAELPFTTMTGTHTKFRVALLQRLADPTRSWHLTENPYLTVDSQVIDLTVFNGEDDSSIPPSGWEDANENPAAGEPYDLYDDPTQQGLNPEEHFQTRERGQVPYTIASPQNPHGPNVWNPISRTPERTANEDANPSPAYWGHLLRHTLGGLNTTYGNRFVNPQVPDLLGSPMQPFPWLTWNNRPYVSQFELMMVPSSSPWRLPFEMRRVGISPPNAAPDLADRHIDFQAPWGHLLNFFFEDPSGPDPNLTVLLDWLEVPSRFVGTQKWLNPLVNYQQQMPELQSFAPPFNKVSRFRDPGKININTIPDPTVWAAIDPQLSTTLNTATPWTIVQQSLAGKEPIEDRPAFYGNPVRAAGSANLMPLTELETSAVDATLFRRHPTDDSKLLFDFPTGNNANDPRVHPYFQYHKLQRLANLLTTHSNVYAVWVTVGHFEVYPWNAADPVNLQLSRTNPSSVIPVPDAAHPDGYQLGPEMGSDSGKTQRHRAFYIIDRSIPAAYKPGQDLNVDRTILLRRYIE